MHIDKFIETLTDDGFIIIPRNGGTVIIAPNGNMSISNNGEVHIHTSSSEMFFNIEDVDVHKVLNKVDFICEKFVYSWDFTYKR